MSCIIFDKQHAQHAWCDAIQECLRDQSEDGERYKIITKNICLDGRIDSSIKRKLEETVGTKNAVEWQNQLKSWFSDYSAVIKKSDNLWYPCGSQIKNLPDQVELLRVESVSSLIAGSILGLDEINRKEMIKILRKNEIFHKEGNDAILGKPYHIIRRKLDEGICNNSFIKNQFGIEAICEKFLKNNMLNYNQKRYIWAGIFDDLAGLELNQLTDILGVNYTSDDPDFSTWLICFKYTLPRDDLYTPTSLEAGWNMEHYPSHKDYEAGICMNIGSCMPDGIVREVLHKPLENLKLEHWWYPHRDKRVWRLPLKKEKIEIQEYRDKHYAKLSNMTGTFLPKHAQQVR